MLSVSSVLVRAVRGVLACLFVLAAASSARAVPTYRMDVTIDNSANGEALTDYQVRITLDTATPIAAGKMRSDGGDIRFVDAGGTPLCHAVESGMDTAATVLWVKVPAIPPNGTTHIGFLYDDPTAASADNPTCTFSFWEGFDDDVIRLTNPCGTVSTTVAAGELALSWTGNGVLLSDVNLPVDEVHLAEAMVTGATGTWPGLYWANSSTQKAYGVLIDATQARISVSGGGTTWCSGHNWASSLITYSDAIGLWQIAWVATGDIQATFPTIGPITSTDSTYVRDQDLVLMVGGISSGTGSMDVDWIRTRKHTATPPSTSLGDEDFACVSDATLCDDADACTNDSCDPGTGCTHATVDCDNADACTDDSCDPGTGCTHAAVDCNDADACTDDSCDPGTGCAHAAVDCDDADACTDDSCEPAAGCAHALVAGPTYEAIGCGIAALMAAVSGATDLGRYQASLLRLLARSDTQLRAAEGLSSAGRTSRAKRKLKATSRKLAGFRRRCQRLQSRDRIPATTGAYLTGASVRLVGDLGALAAAL